MTTSNPNGRADPDAAERLSVAWDALDAGRPTETDDEGLVAVASELHATTSEARERPGFRQNLRDTLMQSPTIAMPTPGGLPGHRIDPTPVRHIAASTVTTLRHTGGRWLSLAATIALLLATAAGGYLAGVGLPGNDGRATSVAGFQNATPAAEVNDSIFRCGEAAGFNPYLPCPLVQQTLGSTELMGAYSGRAKLVRSVQMQGWQVDGGASVSFSPPVSNIVGIGMDLVLNGAYAGTFSTPITVEQGGGPNSDTRSRTVPAGEPVEVGAGDAVTYEIGTRLEVENPLSSATLIFKSILFFEGDPSPANIGATGEAGTYTVTVDGGGSLPYPISEYRQWPGVLVSYVVVTDAFPFPPTDTALQLVLGPVDGPVGAERLEGYVVWTTDGIG